MTPVERAASRQMFQMYLRQALSGAALFAATCLPATMLSAQEGSATPTGGGTASAGGNPNAPAAAGSNPQAPAAAGSNPQAPAAIGTQSAARAATGVGASGAAPSGAIPYYDERTMQSLGPLASRYRVPQAGRTAYDAAPSARITSDGNDRPLPYGYTDPNATAGSFVYDYYPYQPYYSYGDAFPSASVGVVPYGTYFSYRDVDNDGFFDQYISPRDVDGDGLPDSYELALAAEQERRAAVANRVAAQAAAREQEQAQQRAAQAANPGVTVDGGLTDENDRDPKLPSLQRRSVTGTVVTTKTALVNGREHTVAQVRSDSGQTEVIDLGSSELTPPSIAAPGDDIVAIGVVQPVGKQEIVFADQVTLNKREITIDRRSAVQQGVVVDVVRAPVANTEHTIAVLEIDGVPQMVDLGEAKPEELGVQKNATLGFRGVPVRLGEYPLMMAYEAEINGKAVQLER